MSESTAAERPIRVEEMPAPPIEASYKTREVEGVLDLLFYRRLGFWFAQFFARQRISPSQVTLLATVLGVTAGHLYVYEALWLNVIGMLLHVGANLFDNVDGQLARLTQQQSEEGRMLDGIGDNLVFASVYAHICIRYVHGGGSGLIWLIALGAGVCHSMQSAAAEFCRDAYLRFATERGGRFFRASELRDRAARSNRTVSRWLLTLHAGYIVQQELALPRLAELRDRMSDTAEWLEQAYRESHRLLARQARLLGTNARMLVLFAVLFLGRPTWYFIAELTAFNAVFLWLIIRENSVAARLLVLVNERGAA